MRALANCKHTPALWPRCDSTLTGVTCAGVSDVCKTNTRLSLRPEARTCVENWPSLCYCSYRCVMCCGTEAYCVTPLGITAAYEILVVSECVCECVSGGVSPG